MLIGGAGAALLIATSARRTKTNLMDFMAIAAVSVDARVVEMGYWSNIKQTFYTSFMLVEYAISPQCSSNRKLSPLALLDFCDRGIIHHDADSDSNCHGILANFLVPNPARAKDERGKEQESRAMIAIGTRKYQFFKFTSSSFRFHIKLF